MLPHPRFTKPCLVFVLFLTCALLTSCNAMAFISPTPTPTPMETKHGREELLNRRRFLRR